MCLLLTLGQKFTSLGLEYTVIKYYVIFFPLGRKLFWACGPRPRFLKAGSLVGFWNFLADFKKMLNLYYKAKIIQI